MVHKEKLKNAALEYLEQCRTIIPLNGKVPLIKGWANTDFRPTVDDVEKWFGEFGDKLTGIGLRTGMIDEMFVLDLEVEQDLSLLDLPSTGVRAKSGRGGVHYYFSDIGEISDDFTSANLKVHGIEGDVKGNNQYIVAPPSIHPKTGKEYEWIEKIDLMTDLPTAPDWLKVKLKQHIIEKTDWHGVLTEPVLEGSRHNATVQLVGKLLYHIPEGEWDDVAYPLLESWNQTMCEPPLPSKEIDNIFSSLRSRHRGQKKKTQTQNVSVVKKAPMSVKEILHMPESERPEFLVKNIIPEKGITAIAGHPGCGKSWLMMELAKAVALGTNFLQHNEMQSKQANVLIVDEESGVWELRRRMELLEFTEDIPIHFFNLSQFKLDSDESVSYLLKVCTEYDIGLIIFDPFAAMHTGVENSAEEMQSVMSAMQKFTEADVTAVFIHHHRKGGVGGSGLSLRGSSAILGRLDSLIVIEKTEDDVSQNITLKHVKSRRGKNAKPIKIAMIQHDENSPIQLLFSGEASESLLKKDQAKLLILELLKYENLFKNQIVDAISEEGDIGIRNIGQALTELTKEEKIIACKDGGKNYYQLNNLEKDVPV